MAKKVNKVEEIMKQYEKEVKAIDSKYEVKEVKKPDTKELDEKIKYEEGFIARLEFEGEHTNAEMIKRAKERLEKAKQEKSEIDAKYEKDLAKREEKLKDKEKLKDEEIVIKEGEVVKDIVFGKEVEYKKPDQTMKQSKKDELDKADAKNKAIKDLTTLSREISEQLLTKKVELEAKRKEWQEFKYKFEKDENGKTNPEPINREEVEKIHAAYDAIVAEMTELSEMQKQCDQYLAELKAPTQKDVDFMNTWKETEMDERKEEQEEVKKQEEQVKKDEGQEAGQTKKELTDKEKQDIIDKVNLEMENENKNYRNIHIGANRPVSREAIKQALDRITDININEKEGAVYTKTIGGKLNEMSLKEILADKKKTFKDLNIKDICEKIAGGKFKGLLLGTKVNPAIVHALKENPDMVKTYIECLKDGKELPFELSHDLRDSRLGMLDKMKMWVHAIAEKKMPGVKVVFAQKSWNKNVALPAAEQTPVAKRSDVRDRVAVDNKDNKIEQKAAEIMKETENNLAHDVNEMTK